MILYIKHLLEKSCWNNVHDKIIWKCLKNQLISERGTERGASYVKTKNKQAWLHDKLERDSVFIMENAPDHFHIIQD